MKKKIAIIGSGIAGLTIGNFLSKQTNFDFQIYEKKENLPLDEGYGIQLAPNSISILNEIGFSKINNEDYFNPKKLIFYEDKITKICELDLNRFNRRDVKYSTLKRSTLIELLKDAVYSKNLKFKKQIQKISYLKNKLLINFDDNTNDLVDYIIAADGIYSNTRSFFQEKKNKLLFKKSIALRTSINSSKLMGLEKDSINLIMGSNMHTVIYPTDKKDNFNVVSIVRSKHENITEVRELINNKIFKEGLLKNIYEKDTKSWPIYITPKILHSSNKNVFYIGDAFNSMLPTMAQGASQSIESAYELFLLIKKDDRNIQKKYFEKRAKKVKLIIIRSNFNFFVFHISNSFLKKMRNIALKILVNQKRFLEYYLGKIYKK